MITPEDEKRFGLQPLPDVPFIGAAEAQRRRDAYEAERRLWRAEHPLAPKVDAP